MNIFEKVLIIYIMFIVLYLYHKLYVKPKMNCYQNRIMELEFSNFDNTETIKELVKLSDLKKGIKRNYNRKTKNVKK